MVNELIGIQDNKVDLRSIGKFSKDQEVDCIPSSIHVCFNILKCFNFVISCLQEVVLSSEQDSFFKENMYENFGDIGMNIKRMVDDFQQVAKSNQNIQTVGSYETNLSIVESSLVLFVIKIGH